MTKSRVYPSKAWWRTDAQFDSSACLGLHDRSLGMSRKLLECKFCFTGSVLYLRRRCILSQYAFQ